MYFKGKVTNAKTGEPIEKVRVSDGKNITFTDSNGNYELEGWERANVLHVGMLTEKHDDWFKYTANKSGVYDFEVTPVDCISDEFCFFHTSDTEIAKRFEHPWVEFFADKAKEQKPAFIIHTGDICAKDGLCRHYSVMRNDIMGCPSRYVIGNHDYCEGSYGEQLYELIYGPTWWSFDCGDIHFIALSIGFGDKPSGYDTKDQFEWLSREFERLEAGKKVIIFNHNCCYDEYNLIHKHGNGEIDLNGKGVIAWVYGHFHQNCDTVKNGVHLICTANMDFGGCDSSAAGMRKITVKQGEVSSEMMYYGRELPSPTEYEWRVKLSGRCGFCTPVLYKNDIITASMNEGSDKECGIYRIDSVSGEIKWYYKTENEIKNNFYIDCEKIYAQDSAGGLYCIDIESGKLIWKNSSRLTGVIYTTMDVVVAGDTVFAGKQNKIYAYDKSTGKLKWFRGWRKGGGTPARFVKDEKRHLLIFNPQWMKMRAYDYQNNKIVWENGEQVLWFRTNTPLLDGDTLYTGGEFGYAAVDINTGEITNRVRKDFVMDASGAAVADGEYIYIPTSEAGVAKLCKKTLETVTLFPTEPAALFTAPYILEGAQMVEGTPVIDGEQLIFTASDGKVWIYNKNSGECIRNVDIGAPSIVSPIVTDEYIYTADFDGYITKIKR